MLPHDLWNLVTSFLFQCKVCGQWNEYPMYLVCSGCVPVWENVCLTCYLESSKACHCINLTYRWKY
jgi:hypothetical protein